MTDNGGYFVRVSTPNTARVNRDGNSIYNAEPTITDWTPVVFRDDNSVTLAPHKGLPTRFATEQEANDQLATSLDLIKLFEDTGIAPNEEEREYFVWVGSEIPGSGLRGTTTKPRRQIRKVRPWDCLSSWYLERAEVVEWATIEHQPNLIRKNEEAQERARVERLRQQRAALDRQIRDAEEEGDITLRGDWVKHPSETNVQWRTTKDGTPRFRGRKAGKTSETFDTLDEAATWVGQQIDPAEKVVGVVDPDVMGLPS